MKAAILKAFGLPLAIETVPDPILGTGEITVDVVATAVLPYANEVFSGQRKYLLNVPVVPGAGAIGRVRSVGPDATRLVAGDWVLCDPTVRSRDGGLSPDITLQGLSARGDGGLKLQKHFHSGSFAERMLVPTENAFPLGSLSSTEAAQWSATSQLLVPYGGLLAMDLQAGETVLVSGATGHFGSSGVAAALAMGAGCVIAPGRNENMLAELVRRFGSRVRSVKLTGDEAADRDRMKKAAPGPIDGVLDLLPPSAETKAVRAAVMTVREFGRVVLMGGVGLLGGDDLGLPYPWIMRNNITIRGQWMYPREANSKLIRLVQAGLLDLHLFEITPFDLDHANEAVSYAASYGGPFKATVIQP